MLQDGLILFISQAKNWTHTKFNTSNIRFGLISPFFSWPPTRITKSLEIAFPIMTILSTKVSIFLWLAAFVVFGIAYVALLIRFTFFSSLCEGFESSIFSRGFYLSGYSSLLLILCNKMVGIPQNWNRVHGKDLCLDD